MDTTLPILLLRAPPLVRVALAAGLWILVLAFCLLSVAYLGAVAVMAVRRLRRGHDLDRLLLRRHLTRRRRWPARRLARLERRVVWGTLAGGMVDPSRGFIWLPDTVEVFLAPVDFHGLGTATKRLQRQILERLLTIAKHGPCQFRARPLVVFTEDLASRPGRPTLRFSYTEATEQADQPASQPGSPTLASNVRVLHHPYLRPVRPPGPPRHLQVGRQFLIGRLPSCTLVLDHPAVSRRHAIIYQQGGGWFITDAGSSNGTFVNLMPAVEPARLMDGDEIRLGETVTLRFELRPHRQRSS
jgi:FHA domain